MTYFCNYFTHNIDQDRGTAKICEFDLIKPRPSLLILYTVD